ncbi:uncharacterized protein CANTADRAFT_100497 [Suhomyces tanzawaensis NRRL Y-17324]|uniref:Uncharacterized protein n=1 Tax=Suhomyces tanzawaensis NRRL Y-17324 TaxID=984487 RepID=A0A1E4SHN2_9ASCO|nr:uncharacterized protein CANTADRAFT_100497 [Suhomyces tanzawaensis NRRL Y-17324]ODV78932.1 hypothetical protein CANTADRAFT_100497 [Suhomyces tanzawaensis NRRL Y-17324]
MPTNSSVDVKATQTLMQLLGIDVADPPDAYADADMEANNYETPSIEVLESAEILLHLAASGSCTVSAEVKKITHMPDSGKDTNQSNICSLPRMELEADVATEDYGGDGTNETGPFEGYSNTKITEAGQHDLIELKAFAKDKSSSKDEFIGTEFEVEGVVENSDDHLLEFPMNLTSSGKVNQPSLDFLRDIMLSILVFLLVWSIMKSFILKASLFSFLVLKKYGMVFTDDRSLKFGTLCEINYTANAVALEGTPKRSKLVESKNVPDEVDVQLSHKPFSLVENLEVDCDEAVTSLDVNEFTNTRSDLYLESQVNNFMTNDALFNGISFSADERVNPLLFQGFGVTYNLIFPGMA